MSDEINYVYLMEDLIFGDIKIGVSRNLKERRKAVQIQFDTRIAIRYVAPAPDRKTAYQWERLMHRRYKDKRLDSEWFRISPNRILKDYARFKWQSFDLETPVINDVEYWDIMSPKPRSKGSSRRHLAEIRASQAKLQTEISRLQREVYDLYHDLIVEIAVEDDVSMQMASAMFDDCSRQYNIIKTFGCSWWRFFECYSAKLKRMSFTDLMQ